MPEDARPQRQSLREQCDLVDGLASRCRLREGTFAAESWLKVSAEDAAHLAVLADRLFLMADHEKAIRDLVTRRGR